MAKAFPLILLVISFITFTNTDSPIQLYRNNSQIEQNITALITSFPNIQQKSCQNDEQIKYIVFGNSSSSMKAIITCNVHAHEIITAQLCVDFINSIIRFNNSLLSKFQFTLFYIANQVRQSVFDGKYCIRTNQNNIDLNRNFPQGFITTQQGEQTYSGQHPLSQPYSQCLDQLASTGKPEVYLDIHSGQFSLVYYKKEDSQIQDSSLTILQKLKEKYCKNCRLENVKPLNINGQAFQYMKYQKSVKYSSLMEIYGGYNANQQRQDLCFTVFNPLTQRQLQFYLNKWKVIMYEYFQLILQQEKGNVKQK